MKKSYTINDCQVQVTFGHGTVHICNDMAFWQCVHQEPIKRVWALAALIKEDYIRHKGQALRISDRSLVVEIWGHLYYEYYVLRLKRRLNARWFDRLSVKLLKPADIIDCGEKGKDSNRWIWDLLSGAYGLIARSLPRGIADAGLKK
ncbi:hypothetical protein [Olivibacter sitiensis]|uniref:hypothetical protein n=1 Tax=Olivibacter sitiensis TaxID=376470 RepID=UPI000687A96B|nr:hypothetical protein [Olivibacter sitiensis]